ncbi:hotdog fold thioesterase [Mycolicibacterium pulveris]|uniref:PaaI family thioesterase n=1 Tax=Mycolicibacterium pulveris TaxID=36813 RepID=UPI003CF08EF4
MSYPLDTPLGRFGVRNFEDGPDRCVASIPAGDAVNPLTGAPTIAPLAMLVDHAGGLVNHHRRDADEWTVTSELSLELRPEAVEIIAAAPGEPVIATARPFGPKGEIALALCELTHRDVALATATVRSFFISAPDRIAPFSDGPPAPPPPIPFAEKMAVTVAESGGATQVLLQPQDPVLNNSIGIVHGGVSAMALEMVAAAAVNSGRAGAPLRTASLRVNFLREFQSGPESRYVGTALRVGRRTGIAEAQAVGADGRSAIIARVTAYR